MLGASAIALCGALSVAVELHNSRPKFDSIPSVIQFVTDQLNYLITARPTTMNMTNVAKAIIDYLIPLKKSQSETKLYIDQLLDFIEQFPLRDLADNRSIGQHGADVLSRTISHRNKITLLTHCNAGSLATMGYGTALGIVRQLAENQLLKLVYFTETRPYNQGSRLTAYELISDRIPHTMICDSMVGLLMQSHSIDAVVVGADRVTANGDVAHKIGTYQLAILARHHNIPFYVATSTVTVDLSKRAGNEILIEQRPSSEMTTIHGRNIAAEGREKTNQLNRVITIDLFFVVHRCSSLESSI